MINELLRHLASSLPSLTIKSCMEEFETLAAGAKNAASLMVALNVAQSGAPVLFLDVRERPVLSETSDRAALIKEAMAKYDAKLRTQRLRVELGVA